MNTRRRSLRPSLRTTVFGPIGLTSPAPLSRESRRMLSWFAGWPTAQDSPSSLRRPLPATLGPADATQPSSRLATPADAAILANEGMAISLLERARGHCHTGGVARGHRRFAAQEKSRTPMRLIRMRRPMQPAAHAPGNGERSAPGDVQRAADAPGSLPLPVEAHPILPNRFSGY